VAQKTKLVAKKDGNLREEYHILKDNPDVKHGPYTKALRKLDPASQKTISLLLEEGHYSQGKRSGLWKFYHAVPSRHGPRNALVAQGQYANGKKNGIWKYYHIDLTLESALTNALFNDRFSDRDTIVIPVDRENPPLRLAGSYLNDKQVGEWFALTQRGDLCQKYNFSKNILHMDITLSDSLAANTNRRALFLGTDRELESYLLESMDYNFPYPMVLDTTSVIVTFTIEKDGKVSNAAILKNPLSKALGNELLRLISLLDGQWVPAVKDGVPTPFVHTLALDCIPVPSTRVQVSMVHYIRFRSTLRFRLL
jgi:antitoxin component YwqK of YwqJK toxin-antitoxin module